MITQFLRFVLHTSHVKAEWLDGIWLQCWALNQMSRVQSLVLDHCTVEYGQTANTHVPL